MFISISNRINQNQPSQELRPYENCKVNDINGRFVNTTYLIPSIVVNCKSLTIHCYRGHIIWMQFTLQFL